jgi:hypothetical protein
MLRRVTTADRYAFGESTFIPLASARWIRRKPSWTMSSASLTLLTIRYAIENSSGLSSSYGASVRMCLETR